MEPIDPIPDREITPFAAWQAGLLSPREAATAIADERRILSVVQRGNIFSPNSDGQERETVPAVWQPRAGQAAAAA